MAEVRHRVAAGFKPQSPKLQELLELAWPAAMVEGDGPEIHMVPRTAFDVDDVLPLLEGPENDIYYRIEQPDEPVMLFAFDESRLAVWATDEPERFIGFDPRDQIVREDWEGTFAQDIEEAEDYTNPSGEAFWGAAGAGILPIAKSTGRILIGLRSRSVNEPHTWGVFGGAIDKGEQPGKAAKREMKEELGYREQVKLLPAYVFSSPGGGFRFSNFIGLIEDEFKPTLDWETETTKWVTYDELVAMPVMPWAAAKRGGSKRELHPGLGALIKNSGALIKKHAKKRKKRASESIEERLTKGGEKSQSHGAEGRDYDEAFTKALHLLGLQFEENKKNPDDAGADYAGPVWDITPTGPGWHRFISGKPSNIKIVTARHTWTAGGAQLYRDVYRIVKSADNGRITQATAEQRILAATRAMLKVTNAPGTVWLKPKSHAIQKAIVTAANKKDKAKLRDLMHKENFTSKILGNSYKLTMKLDWDKADAEDLIADGWTTTAAFQNANSWQGGFNLYLDGGSEGRLGLTARIDAKGGIRTVAWRDRAKGAVRKPHPVRMESVNEDYRSDIARPRKPGEGATSVYGGFRFHVGKNSTRKPRKDVGRCIQNRLNARRGLGKRTKKAKEWHRSHKGAEMHAALGRYNADHNQRSEMREKIADVRERIARWKTEYQQQGYIGETQIGTYGHTGYTSAPSSDQDKSLDDVFEALLRRLIVAEALDVLQDVEFDDQSGALYLFFDPSLPVEEMDELVKMLQAEQAELALIASPDQSLPGESVESDWWVAFLPGKKGEDGQSPGPDSSIYAAVPEPGTKIQMVKQAPPTPVEQIALDVDVGKLLKSMGGK